SCAAARPSPSRMSRWPEMRTREGRMSATTTVGPWRMRRLGIVMEPDPADPREAGGVLNPAATRGPDGRLSLLPRLVAVGNDSRIGLAHVLFNLRCTPV